jgi:YHS domain-containing protein
MIMNRAMLIPGLVLLLTAAACDDPDTNGLEPQEIRTIENVPARLRPIDPPQQIDFTVTRPLSPEALRAESIAAEDDPEERPTDKWTTNLPFAPHIAMDSVDGSKIAITRDTPIAEYKGRIFYFNSEANRREFIRNPENYLSGPFGDY